MITMIGYYLTTVAFVLSAAGDKSNKKDDPFKKLRDIVPNFNFPGSEPLFKAVSVIVAVVLVYGFIKFVFALSGAIGSVKEGSKGGGKLWAQTGLWLGFLVLVGTGFAYVFAWANWLA